MSGSADSVRDDEPLLQHLGNCRLNPRDVAAAIALFEQALALRRAKGNPSLIESTEQALATARAAKRR